MINKILPIGSRRRKAVKKIARKTGFLPVRQDYNGWVVEQKNAIPLFQKYDHKNKPLISLVVPAFNTPERYLKPLIYSIIAQNYPYWELILVNVSTDEKQKKLITDITELDGRIRVYEAENKGIAANTNFGVKNARGSFVGYIDHDDIIEPDALSEVAKAINDNPKAGLFYSDEDKLSEDGKKYSKPHFKPDWSPDLLSHVNYITHFTVAERKLVEKVGGFDPDKDGAQDYDLILKVADTGAKIVHIPKVLYHWREAKLSTAESISNKPYIKQAGKRALEDHYERLGLKVEVKPIIAKPGFYKTEFLDVKKPTIIITQFANSSLVNKYIEILEKKGILDDLKVIKSTESIKGVLGKCGEKVIIINDFVVPETREWAQELAGYLDQNHVHCVAPVVLRSNRDIEDAGVVINNHEKIMFFKGYKYGTNTYFGDTDWNRNVDELTGNIIVARTDELKEFLEKNHDENNKILLNKYSEETVNKFNVVVGTTPFVHIRSSQSLGQSHFMNPNIVREGEDFTCYPSDKNIMDALEKTERDFGL